jgi:cysteinyl-tRNA synthetase
LTHPIAEWPVTTKLKLFNTEKREIEELVPLHDNHINMYTCGPTVYDYAHIGNFRTYVFEDLLRRTIHFFGFTLTQVMNLTDVDDKTIKGAIAKKCTLNEYTEPYKKAFFEDLKTLGIEEVEHNPAAAEYVPQMVAFIEKLIKKGVAYQAKDGSVYFSISKFPRYGCLSHLKLDELEVGASERVAADEYDKDHVSDFVLWKAYSEERDGGIFWESPFGPGRPGWHLECSCMAMELLGDQIDLHCGGVDNIFPHHENEIAQSEACSGKRFAKMWCHSEHLLVENKKMSKSLGNFYTLRDLQKRGYSGDQIRYLLLGSHYRTQLNFTFEGLDAAKASLHRLQSLIYRLLEIKNGSDTCEVLPVLKRAFEQFCDALADDLNISVGLAAIFDLLREVNSLCDEGKIGSDGAAQILALLQRFNTIIGVLSFEPESMEVPRDVLDALQKREQARAEKNWALADSLRDDILSHGYIIVDTAEGAKVKLKGS